jgi:hypothetical protein
MSFSTIDELEDMIIMGYICSWSHRWDVHKYHKRPIFHHRNQTAKKGIASVGEVDIASFLVAMSTSTDLLEK